MIVSVISIYANSLIVFCNCIYTWLNNEQIMTFVIKKHFVCKSLHNKFTKVLVNDWWLKKFTIYHWSKSLFLRL